VSIRQTAIRYSLDPLLFIQKGKKMDATTGRILLDPTAEQTPATRQLLPRPPSLAGLTVGLLDIAKARGDLFLDQIELRLRQQGLAVRRYRKPTYARVAPLDLKQTIATECDIVVEALAD
jgi:hypothetical protein